MSSVPIPAGATRVKVEDELGKTIWRKPSDILPTDTVSLNPKTGEPFVMYSNPGRGSPLPAPASPAPAPVSAPAQPQAPQYQSAGGGVVNNPQAAIQSLNQRKFTKLDTDPVYGQLRQNPESSDVLTRVIEGLSEEAASLAFEREEAVRKGEPTSQISLRRVNALRAVGDTWIKKRELLSSKSIDMESKAFRKLFGHIAETFRRACDESGCRPELAESIFATFGKLVDEDEWVADAKKAMEDEK